MKFHRYKKTSDYKVSDWLEKSIPELTPYQKQKIRDYEIVRFAPFEFFEKREKINSFWFRLTIIFIPIPFIIFFIALPFSFLFTGYWGYKSKVTNWYVKWCNNLGF